MIKEVRYNDATYTVVYKSTQERRPNGAIENTLTLTNVNGLAVKEVTIRWHYRNADLIVMTRKLIDQYLLNAVKVLTKEKEFEAWDGELDDTVRDS